MEGQTEHCPPSLMEGAVEFLLPPAAREAVAGDLREIYSSPFQYGLAALKVLPFIIVSQARRNANLPLLGLQGAMLYAVMAILVQATPAQAAIFTLLALILLLVRDAYQPVRRPPTRFAILQAQGVSILAIVYAASMTSAGGYHVHDPQLSRLLTAIVLPFCMPILAMLRATLILRREPERPFLDAEVAFEDVARDYRDFARRTLRANRLDIAGLFLAMAFGAGLTLYLRRPEALFAWALLCLFALASAWLLVRGPVPALPRAMDFATVRALYRHELARQDQIRRFMWWLWFSPAFVVLAVLAEHGLAVDRPVLTVVVTLLMALTGFGIAALNRERGGRVQENIGALALMRERRTF